MGEYARQKTRRWREAHPEVRQHDRERARRFRSKMRPVVYLWMAPDGRADYVGRGTCYRALVHRKKPWWTRDHLLVTMTCDSEWQAMEYEGKWGALYQPRYNKEGYRHAG